jgi:Rps23 Pro-64 3,4-dihydroxylase Tpa1-like proline 4-hydroxylase
VGIVAASGGVAVGGTVTGATASATGETAGGVASLQAAPALSGGVDLRASEFILTKYPGKGARYLTHIDESPLKRSSWPRVLTFVWYLNDADGGHLRVHLGGGRTVDIAPKADRLTLFPSQYLRHEVLPAQSDRYALTGWFRAPVVSAEGTP